MKNLQLSSGNCGQSLTPAADSVCTLGSSEKRRCWRSCESKGRNCSSRPDISSRLSQSWEYYKAVKTPSLQAGVVSWQCCLWIAGWLPDHQCRALHFQSSWNRFLAVHSSAAAGKGELWAPLHLLPRALLRPIPSLSDLLHPVTASSARPSACWIQGLLVEQDNSSTVAILPRLPFTLFALSDLPWMYVYVCVCIYIRSILCLWTCQTHQEN